MPYTLAVKALGTKVNAAQPSDQIKTNAPISGGFGAPPDSQMNPRKEFDVSVVTDFGSYELSADHTDCLLQCRFRPNVAWDFYRLDLNERWNLTRPPRVSEYVASLKSQLQVRQPGVWGLVGFGTGLAWVSQSSQLVASLNHTWTIYLALLAFWFVDGRRTTRWFRQQRSTIETPDA